MAIDIRRAHIHDAKELVRSGLLPGSITSAEGRIRKAQESEDLKLRVVTNDDKIICLAKIRYSSLADNADITITITEDGQGSAKDILTVLLNKCFISDNFHKISMILYGSNLYLEKDLADLGFVQEAVLKDEIKTPEGYEDAGLFSLLRPEYRGYNYCFVPFDIGVVIVGGGSDQIDYVKLLHFKDKIEDPFIADVAAHCGFTDKDGCLLKNTDNLYKLDDKAGEFLPQEVWKAYSQLAEYFEKTRSSFTVNLDLTEATAFQKKVWDALTHISYGNMRSYENIANDIADSPSQARHLTRAVGAACSDNPYPILIPCHRVIGKDGTLVGYAAGLDIKDYLLTLETFSYIVPLN